MVVQSVRTSDLREWGKAHGVDSPRQTSKRPCGVCASARWSSSELLTRVPWLGHGCACGSEPICSTRSDRRAAATSLPTSVATTTAASIERTSSDLTSQHTCRATNARGKSRKAVLWQRRERSCLRGRGADAPNSALSGPAERATLRANEGPECVRTRVHVVPLQRVVRAPTGPLEQRSPRSNLVPGCSAQAASCTNQRTRSADRAAT